MIFWINRVATDAGTKYNIVVEDDDLAELSIDTLGLLKSIEAAQLSTQLFTLAVMVAEMEAKKGMRDAMNRHCKEEK